MSRCTCGEVRGEDPNCAKHGRDTEWGRKWAHIDGAQTPSNRLPAPGLVERLNDPRFKGQEGMRREAAAEITRLRDEVERLREALEPFATREFEMPIFDEEGWTDAGLSWSLERIGYWFGPSAFRRARAALDG